MPFFKISADGDRMNSFWAIYRRFSLYLRPYLGRLALGVAAGLVCGGSLYGILHSSGNIFKPWEKGSNVEEVSGPAEDLEPHELIARKFGVEATDAGGRMTWQFMLLSVIALPLLMIVRALATYVNKFCMRWIGARVVKDLRDELFVHLQSQSLKFFGNCNVGRLISRCTNDTTVVEQVVSMTISSLTLAPIEIAVAAAFVIISALQNDMIGLLAGVFIAFPLCIVPVIVLGRLVKRHTRKALGRISDLVSRMHENFTGVRIVKAYNMERTESERFLAMNGEYFRSIIRALRAELLMTPMMEAVAIVLGCVFLVFCHRAGIKLSQIMPIGFAAIFAYRPIKHIAQINANMQRGSAALERIFSILDTDTSLEEYPDAVDVAEFNDGIVFENVSFRYEEDSEDAVSGISMKVPAGSVVAVVGETGSGKTTLANLLARFYDPSEGRITLDGHDLRRISIASLRRLIGVVTQETVLFNDTVAENISYGMKSVSRESVIEAARKANAHDFITALPGGYERVVGEKGFVLSGGERQRVALARAILKNPPILVLDEATSALDTVTERQVQEAIARVMQGRTVFAIAHRLSTIRHADRILLVEKGRIVESGTHDELYAAGGRYKKLCDMQMA